MQVLDFGSQYSHLIVRRLRELNVYAELLACTQKIAELAFRPIGIILSGGYVYLRLKMFYCSIIV